MVAVDLVSGRLMALETGKELLAVQGEVLFLTPTWL